MPEASAPHPQPDVDRLESVADQAIAACGGDAREAVKALIIANEFLEAELEAQVSRGYIRGVKQGRLKTYSG
jgi:Cdc6-like AAA superfamily ATPase